MSSQAAQVPATQTIRMVDDTPANLGMLAELLEARGYAVIAAQDGMQAIERACLVRPDLILLDVMMPGIDGFATCARLKTLGRTRDIPVIFMSALSDGPAKLKGFQAGGVDYVSKPFRLDELLGRIGTRSKPFEAVDCNVLLAKARQALCMSVDESNAAISCDRLPTVIGDPSQLAQLLQNLLANAIKFRRAQTPLIQVAAEPDGDCWRFSVADNGIGIEPDYFEQIFVMSQRLRNRAAYPGTGIGLAICKKIVERHGGRIWVESKAG